MSEADRSTSVARELTFGQHVVAFLRELAFVVLGAIVVAALLRNFVGQMFVIPSSSMENTLRITDRVAVEKLGTVERGEVVVFADPGGWLTDGVRVERGPVGRFAEFVGVLPDTGTDHLIKRVIGLPGDQIVCCDPQGRISVNQYPLDESSYLHASANGRGSASDIEFDVVVPAGRMFVMGDNRDNSRDSRCHLDDESSGGSRGDNAFVSEDLMVGRAFAVVWPASDMRLLRIPQALVDVPPGKVPPPAKPVVTARPEAPC